jgi:hypothetical protein
VPLHRSICLGGAPLGLPCAKSSRGEGALYKGRGDGGLPLQRSICWVGLPCAKSSRGEGALYKGRSDGEIVRAITGSARWKTPGPVWKPASATTAEICLIPVPAALRLDVGDSGAIAYSPCPQNGDGVGGLECNMICEVSCAPASSLEWWSTLMESPDVALEIVSLTLWAIS